MKKKIIALIMASALALSMTVSASAISKDDTQKISTFSGGVLTGDLHGYHSGGYATSTHTFAVSTIIAAVEGSNSYFPYSSNSKSNATSAYATTGELGSVGNGPVSFWGAHEVRSTNAYGVYTCVTDAN